MSSNKTARERRWHKASSDVAEAFLARMAYDEMGRSPYGYDPGHVAPFEPTVGEGSQVPFARDHQGKPVAPPDLGLLEIPGYEWHDTSKDFHQVVMKNASSETTLAESAGPRIAALVLFDLGKEMRSLQKKVNDCIESEHGRICMRVARNLQAGKFHVDEIRITRDRGWLNIEGKITDEANTWRTREEVDALFDQMFDTYGQLDGHSGEWRFTIGGFQSY